MQIKLLKMNEVGIVSDVRGARARVKIGEMVTDYLPVLQAWASDFGVSYSPVRVGEQVLVIAIRDEINAGVILRGLYQHSYKPSETSPTTAKVVFADGTAVSYDVETSELVVSSPKKIKVECTECEVKADRCVVDSPSIDLGTGGAGVVTTECTCAFTGAPHPVGSGNTRSKI